MCADASGLSVRCEHSLLNDDFLYNFYAYAHLLIKHADGNTGHRFMSEFAAQLILDANAAVLESLTSLFKEERAIQQILPPPMLRNNWQTEQDSCFIAEQLKLVVKERVSFWSTEKANQAIRTSCNTHTLRGIHLNCFLCTYVRSDVSESKHCIDCVSRNSG